jgi:hypothetical protein
MSQQPTFDALLEDSVLASFAKQVHLANLIGTSSWAFDMDSGVLTFGGSIRWQAQILGTESAANNTWMWAWANQASGIPPALVEHASLLASKGRAWGVKELTDPTRSIDSRFNGHIVAMIAAHVSGAGAYYRGPYDGGAVYLLIADPSFPHAASQPQELLATFPKVISAISFNHRNAFSSYVRQRQWTIQQDGTRLSVLVEGKPAVQVEFDHLGRLAGIEGILAPQD